MKNAFVQFIEQGYPLPEISVVLFRMLDDVISAASSRAIWSTDSCSWCIPCSMNCTKDRTGRISLKIPLSKAGTFHAEGLNHGQTPSPNAGLYTIKPPITEGSKEGASALKSDIVNG